MKPINDLRAYVLVGGLIGAIICGIAIVWFALNKEYFAAFFCGALGIVISACVILLIKKD